MKHNEGRVRKGLVCAGLALFALCTPSYSQNDNSQGNEDRPAVPSQGRGEIRPHSWVHRFLGNNANPATGALAPSQVTSAYGINLLAGNGQGATVAIVDAFDSPNVASDLANFMTQFGISCATGGGSFTKVNQNGSASPLPGGNSGWEVEINLDTQWVRAMAPCANIVLVEANSNNDSDLITAVNTAAGLASVVTMSWGGGESSSQTSFDSAFLRNGVTFMASSGDTGGVIEWPSSSPNVVAVGGTNLAFNANGTVASETAWNGSGGGCSTVEASITAQAGFVPGTCTHRATPDVSMDGGNSSPVAVLISDQGGWFSVYGTSLSVQLWGGVVAIANGLHGSGVSGTLRNLYLATGGIPSSAPYTNNYRDITSGTAGSFSSGPGWDFVTGLGSPLTTSLVPTLIGQTSGGDFTVSASPNPQTVVQGSGSAVYTVTISPSNGFAGTVALSASGLPSGATASFNPASATTSSTLTVTTTGALPARSYSFTVTGTSGALVHSTSATLAVSDFSLSASPTSPTAVQGAGASSTITITRLQGFAGAVTFSFSPALPAGASASFSPNPAPGNGTSSVFSITTSAATPAGSYPLTVTGTSGTLSRTAAVTLVVNPAAGFTPIRVNAGGVSYTDPSNNVWSADTGFNGGATFSTGNAIANTTTQTLYQTERYGSGTLQYQFVVPNGNYTVNLKFAEIYFNAAGQRVFNILINGQAVQNNFDIVAAAGASFRAIDMPYTVAVSGGQITIQMVPVVNNPKISAIEILGNGGAPIVVAVTPPTISLTGSQSQPFAATVTGTPTTGVTWSMSANGGTLTPNGNNATYVAPSSIPSQQTVTITATSTADGTTKGTATVTLLPAPTFTPIRVNAGGPSYTDPSTNNVWSADTGFNGGATFSTGNAIANTTTQPLYQTERYGAGMLQYQFVVPNGNYTVNLKFAEIYFNLAGLRIFNILINGQAVQNNFDIVAAAGASFTAKDLSFPVTVSGGNITIQLVSVIQNPKISAIEILGAP